MKHPLIIIAHGFFASCADRAAADASKDAYAKLHADPKPDPAERQRLQQIIDDAYAALNRWPCAPGIDPLPSYRGYDYLGTRLASHGFVVASISVDAINGGVNPTDDEFADRAALVNRHLAMWQQLSATGGGPLAAALAGIGFRDHVDLTDVGTIGHSKGGRADAYHAADIHAGDLPPGVTLKATVPLEPILTGGGDDFTITKVPFLVVMGACDSVSNPYAEDYFDAAHGRNTVPIHRILVHGANHNFFNTQWSPASGQVTAEDDAEDPANPPGKCRTTDRSHVLEDQLSEERQRTVGAAYITAFMLRYLDGDTGFDPMLTGASHPLAGITAVDVKSEAPVR